ncbi:hypothetical protein M878_44365 [Streptomyces roseochromogenus subsp. oscitans DS 12.976]|uniref:Uncharacterized protein n=1 Tax=Streptomyces roseochromogenus subsp. oscitans DS 12.976 TaxID=1352936 RepID=V6JQ20_STRRC|nr:hypothetical protein M878_44365 [Streptomyces roseochromogenus subsp. oscitans DS 12.976]
MSVVGFVLGPGCVPDGDAQVMHALQDVDEGLFSPAQSASGSLCVAAFGVQMGAERVHRCHGSREGCLPARWHFFCPGFGDLQRGALQPVRQDVDRETGVRSQLFPPTEQCLKDVLDLPFLSQTGCGGDLKLRFRQKTAQQVQAVVFLRRFGALLRICHWYSLKSGQSRVDLLSTYLALATDAHAFSFTQQRRIRPPGHTESLHKEAVLVDREGSPGHGSQWRTGARRRAHPTEETAHRP